MPFNKRKVMELSEVRAHWFSFQVLHDGNTFYIQELNYSMGNTCEYPKDRYSASTSIFGVQIDSCSKLPFLEMKTRVGLLDDFSTIMGRYHGVNCRDIIDTFDITARKSADEDCERSSITFYPYDLIGTIEETERNQYIDDLYVQSNSSLPEMTYQIALAVERKIAVLLQYLSQAVEDNVRVLAINVDWNSHFPPHIFGSVRDRFRALRDNGCICVVAAGIGSIDLDEQHKFDCSSMLGSDWSHRSLFVSIANEAEFRGNMIVVGASGLFGNLAGFSNYGSTSVHVAAPGERILLKGGYEMAGSAAAASLVAGLVAVMLQAFPNLSGNPSAIIQRIMETTDPLTDFRSGNSSPVSLFGRINPTRALRRDLIGLYGVVSAEDLSLEAAREAIEIQNKIREAEALERKAMPLQPNWKLVIGLLSQELTIYEEVVQWLQLVNFENQIAVEWQEFELDRLSRLVDCKRAALSDWSSISSIHFELFDNLGKAEMHLYNPMSNSPMKMECLQMLYRMALVEVDCALSLLQESSPVQAFWVNLKDGIEYRIEHLCELIY